MKATEQCFPVVLFIMLCNVVLTFDSGYEISKADHFNKIYWAVSFSAVYYAVQGGSTFESVDEILKGDHSNESYWAVSWSAVYYSVQCGSNFWVWGGNLI